MKPTSRRRFLKKSAAAAGALTAGTSLLSRGSAASYSRVVGANDRIYVALIGCGGQGRGNLSKMIRIKNVECLGLCDVDDEQTARTVRQVEEISSKKPALTTRDFRKILESAELSAVIVGTPDHWHAIPTIMACQAGKDVYVEKPLSLFVAEGRAMVQAARKHDRIVQVGTQQRSAPHFREAVEYVQSGKLGKVRLVRAWAYLDWKGELPKVPDEPAPATVDYDMWLGPAPKRPFNRNRFHWSFRWYWDYSGGLMTDWGAHMIDIANWAMGIKAPTSAMSAGGKFGYPDDAMQTPDTQQVIWAFPEYSMIWEHMLGAGRGPEAREHGVAFHGNNGVLVVDRGGWEVHAETDRIDRRDRVFKTAGVPRQGAGSVDYHGLHIQNFIECVQSRKKPSADVEVGHNSVIACHLGNVAQQLGRQIHWDVDAEKVRGDREAESYIAKEYRAPWKLPRV